MKRAFTLLELVFVIIVIGILTAVIIPKTQTNSLREAAIQLVSDIRYTQHLAMMDDVFNTNNNKWYKERWAIRIKEVVIFDSNTYDNVWAYSIFSDKSHDKNPNKSEMAKNPNNPQQYLSGGYNNNLDVQDSRSMKELRLGSRYGITDINFGGGCRSNVSYIHFDSKGRPFNSFPTGAPYELASSGWHKLLSKQCTIELVKSSRSITIAIEPETGYVHIL